MFYVVNLFKGNYSIQGSYRIRESAERRADVIQGGETHVFETEEKEPEKVIREFRDLKLGER